jgi:hypothetical protein
MAATHFDPQRKFAAGLPGATVSGLVRRSHALVPANLPRKTPAEVLG